MKYAIGTAISLLCLSLILISCTGGSRKGQVIHIDLERKDGQPAGSGYSFTTDKARIEQELEKYQPILPDPLPTGAVIVYCHVGPFFGIMQKIPGMTGVRLTLDVNLNHDLTDDEPLELPAVESWNDGIIIRIQRIYETPEQHGELLPYCIGHQVREDREGRLQDIIFICANYDYKGILRLNNEEYDIRLSDGDLRGRYILEKLVNVGVRIAPRTDENASGEFYRLFELATLGDQLYEFKAIAEDGSWLEIEKSNLPVISLGQSAPDMEMTDMGGESFHLSDYRGKVLLLDFWPVWCKPCVAKFPDIKRMVEKYSDRPFAVIGINIDDAKRVEEARKVIAEYELNWRQVVDGKGEFIPSYQVFGRLPENEMVFPVYVIIDEQGTARYATNDYLKVERFLEMYFSQSEGERDVLFIPLSEQYQEQSPVVNPVEFKSEQVNAIWNDPALRTPDGMPEGTRLGLLPNGTVLLAYPASNENELYIVLDSNRDFDLTNDDGQSVPILTDTENDNAAARMSLTITFPSGSISFRSIFLFARQGQGEGSDNNPAHISHPGPV